MRSPKGISAPGSAEIDPEQDPCYKLIEMFSKKHRSLFRTLFSLAVTLPFILYPQPDIAFSRGFLRSHPHQAKQVTTIRNRSREVIHYKIKAHRGLEKPLEKILPIGAVDSYSDPHPLDITFPRGGTLITYRLEPGQPYSFRYNTREELELFAGSHGRPDAVDLAPYVKTPMEVVMKMLEIAGVNETDIVYDLGCGDGRIIIEAARSYGARGVGIDIVPERIAESRTAARKAGVENKVEFIQADATQVDISPATVVTIYLVPESMELLRPILESQLRPGSRIISHGYPVPDWESKLSSYTEVDLGSQDLHSIFAYRR